ncbi:hypothetical protein KJ751_01440 [Patescibacteria group bacterium]|nr:hypothetical protein [Patescibacteria group bacterium]
MQVISTTSMRKNISEVINKVKYNNRVFGVGRRNKAEVIIIKYPENISKKVNKITNINANSSSFDFLKEEPDIYSVKDLKKRYV